MAHYRQEGTVWQVGLSHEEVGHIHDFAYVSTMIAGAAVPPPLGLAIGAVIMAVSGVIRTVDGLGLNNGVNLVGVALTQFVTVTPAFVSPIGIVLGVADALEQATGLPGGVVGAGLGAGITWIAAGPSVVVLGGLAGLVGANFGGGGGPNPGDVHADRGAVGPWEKFTLQPLNPDKVAIASWQGYFCAERDGGHDVHANRKAIGPWEAHRMIRNDDGTVSFEHNGFHLVAENGGGGGSVCNWNRGAIGEWEKFRMEFQPDGTFALRTLRNGTFVSVQG